MGFTSQKKKRKDVTKENSGKGTRTFTTSSIRNSLSLSLSREGRLCGVGVVWSLKEREHHHHRFFANIIKEDDDAFS